MRFMGRENVNFRSEVRQFPLILAQAERDMGFPVSVPWFEVEKGRAQIQQNHGQTLERLAQRGGLDPLELYYGVSGRSLDIVAMRRERTETVLAWVLNLCGENPQTEP